MSDFFDYRVVAAQERIAKALETMTQSWTQLVKERDFYKGRMEEESKRADRYWRERTDEIIRQRRVIAGLRGCVKRARVAKKPAAPAPRRST